MTIHLSGDEVLDGRQFVSVTVPPGVSAVLCETKITLTFEYIQPLECLGKGMFITIGVLSNDVATPPTSVDIIEMWFSNDVEVFTALAELFCPPTTSVNPESWGETHARWRI
jgi:hypothetical protein